MQSILRHANAAWYIMHFELFLRFNVGLLWVYALISAHLDFAWRPRTTLATKNCPTELQVFAYDAEHVEMT